MLTKVYYEHNTLEFCTRRIIYLTFQCFNVMFYCFSNVLMISLLQFSNGYSLPICYHNKNLVHLNNVTNTSF